jgi:hypothetical protein
LNSFFSTVGVPLVVRARLVSGIETLARKIRHIDAGIVLKETGKSVYGFTPKSQ